jgi:hypothetical protein
MINVVSKSGDLQIEENVPKELASSTLPWEGFQLHRQVLVPQTFAGDSIDPKHRHLMTMLLSHASTCDHLGSTGSMYYVQSFRELARIKS